MRSAKSSTIDIGLMEGRSFVVGREGHIYINSQSASKRHAEIRIIDGRIYLRDLNSTNGTYLLKNKGLVHFEKGFVNLRQPIVVGDQIHTIESLLAIASEFVAVDDSPTEVNITRNRAINS